ncbi:hypothetical protein QYF36_002781 [Acer negundo]|nr:hypothetical protein QYF36_002781 [Acer negundo]
MAENSLFGPIPSTLGSLPTWLAFVCRAHSKAQAKKTQNKNKKTKPDINCKQEALSSILHISGDHLDVPLLRPSLYCKSTASVLEAKESSGGQKTAGTDAALENFKQRWELFRVACDQAEEFVESVKQRIGSECLVDEATGSAAGNTVGLLVVQRIPILLFLLMLGSLKIMLNRIV